MIYAEDETNEAKIEIINDINNKMREKLSFSTHFVNYRSDVYLLFSAGISMATSSTVNIKVEYGLICPAGRSP